MKPLSGDPRAKDRHFMRNGIGAVLGVLFALPGIANAEPGVTFTDGNGVYQVCQGGQNELSCRAIAVSFWDMAAVLRAQDICGPSNMKMGQISDVFLQFLTAHPELRHYAAADIALLAYRQAFPCSK